jgi:hypothetical protein
LENESENAENELDGGSAEMEYEISNETDEVITDLLLEECQCK